MCPFPFLCDNWRVDISSRILTLEGVDFSGSHRDPVIWSSCRRVCQVGDNLHGHSLRNSHRCWCWCCQQLRFKGDLDFDVDIFVQIHWCCQGSSRCWVAVSNLWCCQQLRFRFREDFDCVDIFIQIHRCCQGSSRCWVAVSNLWCCQQLRFR